MKIVVVGAGAVGGYFGGRMAAAGLDVAFMCRGKTLEAVRANGIRIESVEGNAHVRPTAFDIPDPSLKADLILWAVKTHQNAEAITTAKSLVTDQTAVLCLQNGVDAMDDLAAAFGADKMIGGFASIAAEATAPAVVRHTALGRITLGELNIQGTARMIAAAGLFQKANIPHRVSDNIRRDLWGKLVWNAAFNPLSVLLQATVEELLNSLAALSILKRAMQEVADVANEEGFSISRKLIESYLDPKGQSGEFRTSMLQDFLRHRPMEVDAISGAVVRRARRHGAPVPVNELFFDTIRYLNKEEAESPRKTSQTG